MDKKKLIEYLNGLKAKASAASQNWMVISGIAASLKEAMNREGNSGSFVFAVMTCMSRTGALPVQTAGELIGIIDSYTDFLESAPEKDTVSLIPAPSFEPFVNLVRLDEIRSLPKNKFDFCKLIKLCEELNVAYVGGSYLSVTMLTRTVLNHVPPIFGAKNFGEVVASHAWGTSKKQVVSNLEESSREISNSYLHDPIKQAEVLPNATQVDFRRELDVLLGEIVRLCK